MEEDDAMGMYEAGEEKSIVMRVPKPMPPPKGKFWSTCSNREHVSNMHSQSKPNSALYPAQASARHDVL